MLVKTLNSLQKEAEELLTTQMTIFEHFNSYRSQWEEIALDGYKKFVGYKDETEEEKAAKRRGEETRSNLHIPRTYQIVDTIRSRMVMAFFQRYPYVEFIPQPSYQSRFSMQQAEDKAQIGSALVNEQLKKNNIVAKYHDYVTSLLLFPKGYLGVGWRYEEEYIKQKVPVPEIIQTPFGPQYTGNSVYQVTENLEKIWDDNEIVNIDFFDFWPDPKGTCLDTCRAVFHREFLTYDELVHKLKFLKWLNEGIVYVDEPNELWEIQGTKEIERGRDWRMSEIGFSDSRLDIFATFDDEDFKRNSEFEILNYWEDNRHIITVNKQKVVYDGPSPYWRHRKKPFVAASYERMIGEFMGMSAVQVISDLQEEENTIHNQRTDNVNFVLNKMWKVRSGADIDESELISRPHGIIHVDRADDVQELVVSDVAASSFNQQNIIATMMENVLATPPVMQGAESRGSKTATETLKQTGNAGMRFDVKLAIFKDLDLKRLFRLMDMNNQQFIDDTRLVRFNINNAIKWRYINPDDLVGEYDYMPASANIDPAASKQIRREQLTLMMQFLLQTGVPFVDYYKLIEEWIRSFDIENAEKYLIPKEQVQKQMMMQAMMQQRQEQQEQRAGPTQTQQYQNAMIGRSVGRRPQQDRNPTEQSSGVVR